MAPEDILVPGANATPEQKPLKPQSIENYRTNLELNLDPLDADPKHISTARFREALAEDDYELEVRTDEAIYKNVLMRINE